MSKSAKRNEGLAPPPKREQTRECKCECERRFALNEARALTERECKQHSDSTAPLSLLWLLCVMCVSVVE